jgi:hypothetical protein
LGFMPVSKPLLGTIAPACFPYRHLLHALHSFSQIGWTTAH